MGCCAAYHKQKPVIFDEYHLIEKNFGLSELNIAQFSQILRPYRQAKSIELSTLSKVFRNYQFGQALATPRETELKLLIMHPLFFEDHKVSLFSLICLGLIYAGGTLQEKHQVIWDNFDLNSDGFLFINTVRKILTNIFTIVGIIVPSLQEITTKNPIKEGCIRILCDQKLSSIFKNEIRLKKSTLYSKCKATLGLCQHPVSIRERLEAIQAETSSSQI